MHEATLRDFLTGVAAADGLREDLVGTVEEVLPKAYRHHIVSLDGEFTVTAEHLVRLCDAVLAGSLQAEQLATIGLCMIASDYFHWDDKTPGGFWVGETLHDWSSPEINYPLTKDTVKLFRERLVTHKDVLKNTQMA
jgi:hypothetical protein